MRFAKNLSLIKIFFLTLVFMSGINLFHAAPQEAEAKNADALSWDVDMSHPYVKKTDSSQELVNIKLSGRKDVPLIARAPVNLVLVIDRSGSMSDWGKLDYAKQAAKEIINRLESNDRLSIVAYSTEVQVLYPMQTLSNKEVAISAVNSLYPTNSTNLSGGLIYGISQLESVNRSGYINRVILLSDGLANVGITDIGELSRISSRASEKNIHITTMGLGLDFDENLMMSLAQYGAGNYYFIESPNQLAGIFQKEFGQLSTTIAKAPVITITLEPGVSIEEVYGYTYSSTPGGEIKIKLGDMYAGQQRDILIKMRVPSNKLGDMEFVKASLSYEDLLNNNKTIKLKKELSYRVTEDENLVTEKENKQVSARGLSVEAAMDLDRGIAEYEDGNSAEALSHMNDAYERIKLVNRTKYRNEQTVKQEQELSGAIRQMEAMPPPPESDEGKELIKKQKANALGYQK